MQGMVLANVEAFLAGRPLPTPVALKRADGAATETAAAGGLA